MFVCAWRSSDGALDTPAMFMCCLFFYLLCLLGFYLLCMHVCVCVAQLLLSTRYPCDVHVFFPCDVHVFFVFLFVVFVGFLLVVSACLCVRGAALIERYVCMYECMNVCMYVLRCSCVVCLYLLLWAYACL
jgi:hypothetical protein